MHEKLSSISASMPKNFKGFNNNLIHFREFNCTSFWTNLVWTAKLYQFAECCNNGDRILDLWFVFKV